MALSIVPSVAESCSRTMPLAEVVPASASRVTVPPRETAPALERPVPAVMVIDELAKSILETVPSTIMVLSMPLTLNSVPTTKEEASSSSIGRASTATNSNNPVISSPQAYTCISRPDKLNGFSSIHIGSCSGNPLLASSSHTGGPKRCLYPR